MQDPLIPQHATDCSFEVEGIRSKAHLIHILVDSSTDKSGLIEVQDSIPHPAVYNAGGSLQHSPHCLPSLRDVQLGRPLLQIHSTGQPGPV